MKKFALYIGFTLFIANMNAQQAGFTPNQPSKCAPSTVTFINNSTGSPSSYSWNFGDGTPNSNAKDPQHPFLNAGTYTVTLTVNYGGTISTHSETITVINPPVFTFTKLNDSVCPGGSVSFLPSVTSPSIGAVQSYLWDFGDGGSSSSTNPTYQYMNVPNQPVRYTISLTVTDTNGCSSKDTISNYIYVKPKPIVDFSVDKSYFCLPNIPAMVTFSDSTTVTTNNIYLWNFGDGGTSTQKNPTHGYQAVGNYSVSLTVTSSEGCSNTLSKSRMVEVIDFTVDIDPSDTIFCSVPANVSFRVLPNRTNVEYFWSFGDDSTGQSSLYAATHTYRSAGTYIVTLVADYRNGICFSYDTVRVHVYDRDSTEAHFSINGSTFLWDTILCDFQYPSPVVFADATQYPTADDFGYGAVSWWFGDGDSIMNTNPASHIFSSDTDYYHITMRITTPYGCPLETMRSIWFNSDTNIALVFSTSGGGCAPYNADAAIYQACGESKAVVFIYDWGDGSPPDTLYDWDTAIWNPLTDWGNWSRLKPIYDTLTDGYGRDMRCPEWVPPWIPCACGSLLGRGTHTYTDTGIFTVTVTFTTLAGCTYTRIDSIPVGYPPKSWFIPTYKEECFSQSGEAFTFVQAFDSLDAQGNLIARSRANEWFWSDTALVCPWVVFKDTTRLRACDTGYQNIRLIPFHNRCPGDTVYMYDVSYVCPPIAGFITDGDSIEFCGYPVTIKFNNLSRGATGYKWFFGDEEDLINQSTDTTENPIFTYSHATPFLFKNGIKPGLMVTLIAYNDDSLVTSPTYNRCHYCEDTALTAIYIAYGTPKLFNSPKDICQGNIVTFYDSGTYNIEIAGWSIQFFADNPLNAEHPSPYGFDILDPRYTYEDIQEGFSVVFNTMDNYTAVLTVVDFYDCLYYDTITFSIFPQSNIAFASGKDGILFTKSKDTLCANYPDLLYLRDFSYTLPPFDTAEIVQWKWKMYQDTTLIDSSTLQNPTFLNTVEGLYDLSLHIVNEYGCTTDAMFQNQILVNKITAAFYPGQEWYCNHTDVEFYNLSYISPSEYNRNTPFTYTWDFGDGSPPFTNTGINDRVFHTYHSTKSPDTVPVTLTVSANDGACVDTYIGQVVIMGPIASFTDDGHLFPCPDGGRQINFQSTSAGNPTSYYWNFGDTFSNSNESNLKDPMHDYSRAGYYDVTLAVQDNLGCKDTLIVPKHVFIDGPIGDFLYGELSGCVEHTVTFTPLITIADSIMVNPDGAVAISGGGANVNDPLFHTYTVPAAYVPYFYLILWVDTVRCVVEWSGKDTVFVIDMFPDFETDSLYCSQGDTVLFPNTTTLLPDYLGLDSAIWSFGNGDTSHAIDGQTQYNTVGTYAVNMTVYAKKCSKQISKNIEVIDLPNTVNIDPDSADICGDELTVLFTASFKEDIPAVLAPQYEWVFDDGEIFYGNPASRTFYSTGVYPYQLLVTFGQTKCVLTYFDTVLIQVRAFPTAEFDPVPQTANYGEEIQFIDKSVPGHGNLIYWYWNLGDTTDSYLQNPTHGYTTRSGPITVSLWIEDEFGCRDSIEHEVLILESLDFPNIFTPIGSDGKRYFFRPVEDKGFFKEFQISVYNRWGNLVWENTCEDPGCPDYGDNFWWNGTNKFGKPVSRGVYFWVVHAVPLSGTKPMIKNGSVTVVGE